jgi:hypothetical protein
MYDTGLSDTVAGSTPIERLWDDQSGRLVEFSATGQRFHRVDLRAANTLTDLPDVNRLLVPAGHNFGNDREFRFEQSAIGDFTDQAKIVAAPEVAGDVGMVSMHRIPSALAIDGEFAAALDSGGFQIRAKDGLSGTKSKLGEFWITETRQPTTGVAHEWTDEFEPNLERADTRSGNTYVAELGDPRRTFTLEHRALSGSDADLYDELLAAVGYGRHPFWYEHPDSGDATEQVLELGSTVGWAPVNCTLDTPSGSDGEAGGALRVTAIASGTATIARSVTGSEPTYFRDSVLRCDTFLEATAAWLVGDFNFYIRLSTTAGEHPTDPRSEYSLARGLRTTKTIGQWIRTDLDLDDGVSSAFLTTTAVRNPSLSAVDRIIFVFGFTAADQQVRLDGLNLTRKDRLPKLVELLGYERTQDSPAPLTGPTYRVRLQMREVLS